MNFKRNKSSKEANKAVKKVVKGPVKPSKAVIAKKVVVRKEEPEFVYSKPVSADLWLCCIKKGKIEYYMFVASDNPPLTYTLMSHFELKRRMWRPLNTLAM